MIVKRGDLFEDMITVERLTAGGTRVLFSYSTKNPEEQLVFSDLNDLYNPFDFSDPKLNENYRKVIVEKPQVIAGEDKMILTEKAFFRCGDLILFLDLGSKEAKQILSQWLRTL